MLYFNKGCLQESGWYITYYVSRDRLCYTLTNYIYKNQAGILRTYVPREMLYYTLTKDTYKNQEAILLTYVPRDSYVILQQRRVTRK